MVLLVKNLCLTKMSRRRGFSKKKRRFWQFSIAPPKKFQMADIVGKKRDLRMLDPMIFSGKIRKNRKSLEKYFVSKFFGKLRKDTKKLGKILKKIRKNSLEKIKN